MADILLIDDEEIFREVLASALTQAGHTVRPAELVITDSVMPEKEGLDTIRDLHRDFPHARIIAMSGGLAHDSKLYLHMAEKFGAAAVLAKPFSLADLNKTVNEVLAAPGPKDR
jgi:CheY-like chemotaxis protein